MFFTSITTASAFVGRSIAK